MGKIKTTENNLSHDEIVLLSRLYERLGAMAEELDYCKKILSPDQTSGIDDDIAMIYKISDRVVLWATGSPPVKRY